jgi:K+ transporter
LIGGNQVRLSAAALTDIVNGTYVVVLTAAVATVMIRYQKRDEIRASRQQKQQASADNTSAFGRPLRKVER